MEKRWRPGGALHMADGEKNGSDRELLDVVAIHVLKIIEVVERTESRLERSESKVDSHIIDTRTDFARVDRRLGHIVNRVESLETYATKTDQRLEAIESHAARTDEHLQSIEAHAARSDLRLGVIETHVDRADRRLAGIEANVAHIDSTLLKLL